MATPQDAGGSGWGLSGVVRKRRRGNPPSGAGREAPMVGALASLSGARYVTGLSDPALFMRPWVGRRPNGRSVRRPRALLRGGAGPARVAAAGRQQDNLAR